MRLLTMALLCLAANSAFAQSFFEGMNKFYVGGGANYVDTNVNDVTGSDVVFRTVELHGGYKYNGFLGVEARVGVGLDDEDISTTSGPSETSLDYHASIYWRPETSNQTAKIYGLLGYSSVSVTSDFGGTDDSSSESGVSYGGGVGFAMYEDWNLNFEYRWILDDDDNEFSAFGATVDYRF